MDASAWDELFMDVSAVMQYAGSPILLRNIPASLLPIFAGAYQRVLNDLYGEGVFTVSVDPTRRARVSGVHVSQATP